MANISTLTVGGTTYNIKDSSDTYLPLTGGAVTGVSSFPALKITGGRAYGSGDDEGIVIGYAPNGYAGLILGSNTGRRSILYLEGGSSGTAAPRWVYNDGTSSFSIYHPKANGTICLTGHTHGAGDITSGTLSIDRIPTITAAKGGTGQTSLINSANTLLNALDTGSSTPVDADYYISQYVNGGTTTTTYHRRPMSALWSYISGKITKSVITTALGYTPPTQDTNTTYPIYYKALDANYTTSFRTETKGNANNGDYIATIRTDTASIAGLPQYSTGLAFGRSDTQGYIMPAYGANGSFWVGGGNADKINWKVNLMTGISNITRSGTTFTATKLDGTTFTFDQQDTNTWRPIGTGATDAAAGNHTHSYLPLSGGTMTGTTTISENSVAVDFRNNSNYRTTLSYQTTGNEALVAATKNAVTSFIFVNGEDSVTNHGSDRWTKLTGATDAGLAPGLQIKNNCVSIGALIPSGTTPTYKLAVAGTLNATGAITQNGTQVSLNGHSHAWSEITGKPSSFTPASHTHNYAGSSSAGGPANYVTYLHTNEINFAGGKQTTCYFNYRLQSTDAADTSPSAVTYKFCNYTSSSANTTIDAANFTGNAASATKATQDGNGNNIVNTYANKAYVQSGTTKLVLS